MAQTLEEKEQNLIAIGPADDTAPQFVWRNGDAVPWAEARIHIHEFAFSAPSCVFEGIKAYRGANALSIFRLQDHVARFFDSMMIFRMKPTTSPDEVAGGVAATVAWNEYEDDCYIVPLAFWEGGGLNRAFSVPEPGRRVEIWIMAWPFVQRSPGEVGMDCCVTSWRRVGDETLPPRVKAVAHYQSMRLAFGEAQLNGYDSAITLTLDGKVSEGIGACIFIRRGDRIVTPSVSSDILEGVTRATVSELLRTEFGSEVEERPVDRSELYVADEVFLAGTGVEIMPVTSIDRIPVGEGVSGDLTKRLAQLYDSVVRGNVGSYQRWLTPISHEAMLQSKPAAF